MTKLLLIVDFIPRGPRTMEKWLVAMAAALRVHQIEFHLLLPEAGPEWFRSDFASAGGVVHAAAEMRGCFHRPSVDHVLRSISPQGLCVMFYPMLAPKLLKLAWWPGLKQFFYIDQSSTPLQPSKGLKGMLIRLRGSLLGRLYHRIITVADFKRDRLVKCLGLPVGRITRIYNGVPMDRFATAGAEVAKEAPIFYAGQIAEYKGVRTLVEAWLLADRTQSMPDLVLAGDGPLRQELLDLIAEKGYSERVQLPGLCADIPERMMASRFIVIPSEWDEACAFVALEAMASGRPVVASDAGSLPELLGETGVIYPRGDSAALARALQETTEANGAGLRQRALSLFDMDQMVKAYTEVFSDALRQ